MKLLAPLSLCLLILLSASSCTSDKKALPPLSYTGTEPRVQDPLSPEDSRQHIQLPEGFRAELFAAEPDIINPIAFTWDEKGRLWVVQSQDYPHELENVHDDRASKHLVQLERLAAIQQRDCRWRLTLA